MIPEINGRIQVLINKYYSGNIGEFSKAIGHDYQKISRLFKLDARSNKYPLPSYKIMDSIINKFTEMNPDWFFKGELPMLITQAKVYEAKKHSSVSFITTAPLISQYAAAGYLAGYSDPEYIEQQPTYSATKKYSGGNYVAFEIRGDSMNDGLLHSICNGDIVLGKELRKEYWKSKLHLPRIFIIVHRENGILCKEIIDHDVENGVISCHSFNSLNNDFELNLNDIAQLFYIKETTRAY